MFYPIGVNSYYSIAQQWTADPRVLEVIRQLDEVPYVRQAFLQHISDPTGEFHDLISVIYNIYPIMHQIYYIKTKLRRKEFVDVIQL